MVKTKSFTAYNADELERKINTWLEKEKDVKIIEVSQSQNQDGDIVVIIFFNKTSD